MEIWKDIEEWEGYYQVSNLGNVKSLKRQVTLIRGSSKYQLRVKERIMKPGLLKGGYLRVNLSKDQTESKKLVHCLVAVAFVANPNNLPEVNHKDHDPSNNNDWNLEWTTTRENSTHKFFNKKKSSRYPNVSWCKLTSSWAVHLQIKGKQTHFGLYQSEEAAYKKVLSVLKENGIINKYAEVWQ